MSRLESLAFGGALVAACLGFGVEAARACSVCMAGDPIYDAQGTTVQASGDFSAFLQVKGWKKTSGHLPGGHGDEDEEHEEGVEEEHEHDEIEHNDSKRLDLFLSWTPIDRLTLTLDLPWVFNEITEVEGDERTTSRISGFGDMSLQVSGVLWRNRDVLPSSWIEGRSFLKFPTGKSEQKRDGVRDPHLQAGTGSWDFGFGLAAVHRLAWASLYASASYRVNTEGSLDYEYGDVFLANAAVQVPLGHALGQPCLEPFTAGFELNYRWADYDWSDGERFVHSGGSILYLTPSLRVQLPWFGERRGPGVWSSVQIPATSSWLYGFQEEDPIWSVGIQYTF